MTIRKDNAGQFLFIGFDGKVLDDKNESFLLRIKPGGIILFKRNIESASQLIELCHRLHNLYEPPPILGIDQEGGMVNRLSFIFPDIPDAHTLARHGNDDIVESVASLMGKALKILGIDCDFAPVLDLCTPYAPNGIANRSFGTDPDTAITMGSAFLRGLLGEGVAGTLKHFPGLGSSEIDSHTSLPTVSKSKNYLLIEDIRPFDALSEITPLIMIGHGHYPSFSLERLPATLCPEIITDVLRKEIGFQGLIISDDMEMGAMQHYLSSGEEAVRAIAAGCNMVMYCSSQEMVESAHSRIVASMESGKLPANRILRSLNRIQEIRKNFVDKQKARDFEEPLRKISEQMREISEKVGSKRDG
ncbi:MAG: beta-N-acetylhexosaminidase [Acidobacteriota bacterium]